jgi:pimeloyl-ACP methyl ester carboxylesterase
VTSFVLLATRGPTTPIAVEYAVRHPDRVAALIVFNAAARAPELMVKQIRDMLALADGDWRFASEGVSRLVLGWDDEVTSRALAELLRASTDFDGFERWIKDYATWDVRHLLPKVQTRALLTSTLGHGRGTGARNGRRHAGRALLRRGWQDQQRARRADRRRYA